MTQMRITLWRLWLYGACKRERRIFRRMFGYSAAVTPSNVLLAGNAGLSINWLLCKLRTPEREKFLEQSGLRNHLGFKIGDKVRINSSRNSYVINQFVGNTKARFGYLLADLWELTKVKEITSGNTGKS